MNQYRVHLCDERGGFYNCVDVRATDGVDGQFTITHPENLTEAIRERALQQLIETRERQIIEQSAEARSKELLIRLLSTEQRKTFMDDSRIYVTAASGRRYRIDCHGGYSGNIHWLAGGGGRRGSYCIYPTSGYPKSLPRHDAFLGQLLLLTTDEEKFRRVGVFFEA